MVEEEIGDELLLFGFWVVICIINGYLIVMFGKGELEFWIEYWFGDLVGGVGGV